MTNRQSSDYLTQFSLTNQRVLLTGSTGGIGAITAKTLSAAGASVILQYGRDEQKAQALADDIQAQGGEAICVKTDLSDEQAILRLFSQLVEQNQIPSCLVNMAGCQDIQDFASMTPGQWRNMMAVNQDAVFLLSKHFCELASTRHQDPAIVNIASIEGLDPTIGHSHYAVSKASVLMLTRAVAIEMAGTDVRVNSVSPGLIHRPNLEEEWPDGYERWCQRCPLGKTGQAEDVANAICYLLSPAAKWVNGTNLIIDGGMSARDRW